MKTLVGGICLTLACLNGCTSGHIPWTSAVTPVIATVGNDQDSTVDGCSPSEVKALVVAFFAAINRGDQDDIASFIDDDFQWYSMTLGESQTGEVGQHVAFIAYGANLSTKLTEGIHYRPRAEIVELLLDYFRQRHAQNQLLQLRELSLNGGSATSMDISFALSRYADDLAADSWGPLNIAVGKGNVDCQNRKINVWSMAMVAPATDSPQMIPLINLPISGVCRPTPATVRSIVAGLFSDAVLVCVH